MHSEGPEGPVGWYAVDTLPPIVPVRVAIQRVLETYLTEPAAEPTDHP